MARQSKPDIKPKGRGKRKVVSDSEDDDEPLPKKSTPQKTATKKPVKQELPKGEATTTSDYFGTKNKPSRTTAVSSRQAPKKEKSPVKKASTPKKPEPAKATPKATPKSAAKSAPTSARSQRTSTRKATPKSYAEHDGDEDEVPLVKKDDDSGEDIFGADYKRGSKKMNDDYESDEDDNNAVLAVSKKNANGRKRKSAELSDEEDDEPPKKVNGSKASTKKAAAPKKPRSPAKKKGPEPEDQEMQDIFDSIPQVRPPTPPAPDETKKFNYAQHAARSQPAPQAGSKEIPEGAENCLAGLTFVFTGLQQTLGREEGQELVKRYGGKVTITPSSKTDYVVIGANAGPTKLATIAKLKIKTIDEDGLFALISKLPAHGGSGKNAAKAEEKRQAMEKKIEEEAEKMDRELKKAEAQKAQTQKAQQNASGKAPARVPKVDDELWTTKYAPSSTSQICGNKTQVEKLQNWLRNWKKSAASNFKKGGPDGSGLYRAVMLYGGPGIGKTTAAHLVAKIEGYDIVESNASDTRSKKLVETGLKGILDTTSLLGYFSGDGKQIEAAKKNLVLIMDEVDGMSAGDRGGVGAMAAVCRKTNIPIICICNDRKLPKMKPFDHVTFDLPFRKPTTDQIRSRIMTILFREGMKDMVPPTVVNALIEGSNADIRRIINMISTAKVDSQSMDFQEGKKMVGAWEKHVILKPWDITQKILGGHMFGPSSRHTLNEKTELYFNDHEFSSLMLQENYLSTNPVLSLNYSGKEKTLKLLELADRAAESISDGDLCDKMIHGSQQQWSLMPAHAIFSFVRPASFMYGSTAGAGGGVRFTSWLGNNSKQGMHFVKLHSVSLMLNKANYLDSLKTFRLICASVQQPIVTKFASSTYQFFGRELSKASSFMATRTKESTRSST